MFKITARTVLELGSELISSDIIAFYELIKNGFDAGTTDGVDIKFNVVIRRNDYLYLTSLARNTEPADSIDALKEKAASKLNKDAPMSLLNGCIDLINGCTKAKE